MPTGSMAPKRKAAAELAVAPSLKKRGGANRNQGRPRKERPFQAAEGTGSRAVTITVRPAHPGSG